MPEPSEAIMTTDSLVLKLHPSDNVAIARAAITKGAAVVEFDGLVALADVPAAHKLAIAAVAAGDPVLRYGQIIGFATRPIERGEHVHTHNLAMGAFKRDYIGIVSTVNCSATVTKLVVEHFSKGDALKDYPYVDGVVPITHSFGCCIDHKGDGVQQLRRTLGGYVKHANFAGVVVVGLGCEANQMGAMFMSEGIEEGKMIAPLVIQEKGGTRKTVEAAIAAVESMLPVANLCRRRSRIGWPPHRRSAVRRF